ncbi:MAG: AI-2E family transporter [Candidatus Dormibacteraeota bacterium]|uniref:AI-2E family transporter n=1 Tax=Candidatus Amunia macphersoniae TaxID=3127014 RepID=A0A934KBT0_9BACT|nr:AI-2E family transporter [Candidatus Dormibacteraeota bacterium]
MPEPAAPQESAAATVTPVVVVRPAVTVRTLVVSALVVIGLLGLLNLAASVVSLLLIILVAIVFAEGLRPLVNLGAKRMPRPLAIAAVYVGLLTVLAVVITLLVQPIVDEAKSLAQSFPSYQSRIQSTVASLQQSLKLGGSGSPNLGSTLAGGLDTAKNVLLAIGGYIVSTLVNLVLVLVIGFLWLVTAERLKRFVVDLMPLQHQALAADVFREMGLRMGGFLRATAINMLVVGVLTGLACAVIGLPSPVLLGIFAGLTAAIPLVGPFLGIVPPLLLGLTLGPGHTILVVAVLLVVQLLDANLVVPLVMNRVVSLPALAVVMSLLVGGALEGLIGALLAVPVASALQVVFLRVIVPYIQHTQGRDQQAFARAYTPLSPVQGTGPIQGGRRHHPR